MKWSKEKAYDFLNDIYEKSFLKTLSDEQLFDLMKLHNYVEGDNPFKTDKQTTLEKTL